MKVFVLIPVILLMTAAPVQAETGQTVAGEFINRFDDASVPDAVCFIPNVISAKDFPPAQNGQEFSFCFTNTQEAKRLLRIPDTHLSSVCGYHGVATVRIQGYQPTQNTADLWQVMMSGPVKIKPCLDLMKR